jgi:hypothetical protein
MTDDVVIVALRNESFERARSLLSRALNATWTEQGGRWRLHRTPAQQRQDESREFKRRLDSYTAYQERIKVPSRVVADVANAYVKDLLIHVSTTEGGSSDVLERSPLARAVLRLAAELDPRFLARLPLGRHTVLSGDSSAIVGTDHNSVNDLIAAKAATIADAYHSRISAAAHSARLHIYPLADRFTLRLSLPSAQGDSDHIVEDPWLQFESPVLPRTWPDSLNTRVELSPQALELDRLGGPALGPGNSRAQASLALMSSLSLLLTTFWNSLRRKSCSRRHGQSKRALSWLSRTRLGVCQ